MLAGLGSSSASSELKKHEQTSKDLWSRILWQEAG